MAKAEFVFIQGMLKWVRHVTPNEWHKWAVVVYPTPESLEIVRDLQAQGLKNTIKKDEDGYYVSFNRPTSKVFKGVENKLLPPDVLGPDGVPMRETMIGNGSKGIVKLEVYSHGTPTGQKAKAARWVSLKVTEHVPYEPDRDFSADEKKTNKGLEDQVEEFF